MSILNSIRAQAVPITPEGYPFIGAFALVALILFWLWSPLGWLGTLLTVWCIFFFRDPPRVTPVREGLVVAPADGRISQVTTVSPPPELGLGAAPLPRISIFMSVFDCHINRSPIAGLVARRIVCFVRIGQPVGAGERFGMIRFGSRLDVYLPEHTPPLVAVGQTAVAGETVLADFRLGDGGRSFRAD